MEEQILNIVSSFVGITADKLKNSIDEEGVWDSLQKVEIIIAVEDEYDISFAKEEIAKINTIRQLITISQGKI